MTSLTKEKSTVDSNPPPFDLSLAPHEVDPPFTLTTPGPNAQLLLQKPTALHANGAGVNPLVDAAAFIFSSLGQVRSLTNFLHLGKLQKELIADMNAFHDAAKAYGYSNEYILVARYALCATLDDVIGYTSWGQDKWQTYALLPLFNQNQDTPQTDNFFLILERIVKEPQRYIDVMELMYICLTLGYQGSYRTESTHQLECIRHSLYKHIKVYQGDFSKILSPPSPKLHSSIKAKPPKLAYWFTFFISASIILLIFIGLGYALEHMSSQLSQALMHIGNFSSS